MSASRCSNSGAYDSCHERMPLETGQRFYTYHDPVGSRHPNAQHRIFDLELAHVHRLVTVAALLVVTLAAFGFSAQPAVAQFESGPTSTTTSSATSSTSTSRSASTTSTTVAVTSTTVQAAPTQGPEMARTGVDPPWVLLLGLGALLTVGGEVGRRRLSRDGETRKAP